MSLFEEGLLGPDIDPERYLNEGEEVVGTWRPEKPALVISTGETLLLVSRIEEDRNVAGRLPLAEVRDATVETTRSMAAYLGVRLAVLLGAAALGARALGAIDESVALLVGAFAIVLLGGSVVLGRRTPMETTLVLTTESGEREFEFDDEDEAESLASHVRAFSGG